MSPSWVGQGHGRCGRPGLEAELREAFPGFVSQSHPFKPQTKADVQTHLLLLSRTAAPPSWPGKTPRKPPWGGPQAVSACEQPHLRCICLWRREGGRGRQDPPASEATATNPIPSARQETRGCCRSGSEPPLGSGVSYSSLGICPGGSTTRTQEQEDAAWHGCSGLLRALRGP